MFLGLNKDALQKEAILGQISRFKPGISMDEMGRKIVLSQQENLSTDADEEGTNRPVERMRG